MTDSEINVAIAGECHLMLDFCNDLNAMHEAYEYLRAADEHAFCCMTDTLETIVRKGPLWHATSRQRAEAFLRTVGKWKD